MMVEVTASNPPPPAYAITADGRVGVVGRKKTEKNSEKRLTRLKVSQPVRTKIIYMG